MTEPENNQNHQSKRQMSISKRTQNVLWTRCSHRMFLFHSSATIPTGYLASFWNLPMFTPASTDPALRNKRTYSTLVRLGPPFSKMGAAIVEVFQKIGGHGTTSRGTELLSATFRFPVTAVSLHEANALVSWLPRHGRVEG